MEQLMFSLEKNGDSYYVILKDGPIQIPILGANRKTIGIKQIKKSLLGPLFFAPAIYISPNFREAPMLIPSPDDKIWYMYYEQYPGVSYGLSIADNPNGPWSVPFQDTPFNDLGDKYSFPGKKCVTVVAGYYF